LRGTVRTKGKKYNGEVGGKNVQGTTQTKKKGVFSGQKKKTTERKGYVRGKPLTICSK